MSTLTVHFAEPPPAQAEGGLEQAMATLAGYFRRQGLTLRRRVDLQGLWREPSDLVHFHGLWQPAHAIMSLVCRLRGIPYIVSPHGMLEPWAWQHKGYKKRPYFTLVEKYHLNGAAALLTTSTQEADNLAPYGLSALVETIPLPIPEKREPDYEAARAALGWGPGERVLLYLSRVHPKKGLHLLLEALTELSPIERRGIRLVVVGDGPADYVEQLHTFTQDHRKDLPPIDWEGAVWGERKWHYLQGADLFCLPTHSENFGIVVLEALQVGTPVLTTNATPWGFIEAWSAGYTTVPAVHPICTALQTFLVGEAKYASRQELAARTHEQFAIEVLGRLYENLYKRISGSA